MGLIKSPQEIKVNPTVQGLVYGQAGIGKTTLALSSPKPLLLDFDNGVSRVNPYHQCDTVQITSYQDAIDVFDNEDLSSYQSIIIDTGGKLLDYMSEWLIAHNTKLKNVNGGLTLPGFGARKAEFKNFCRRVRTLNKHLIFVAHRETQKNGDDTRYVPLFGGSSYDDVVTELDFVGYMEAIGSKRILTFDPTDRNDGKNTINMPAKVEVPGVVDENACGLPNTFVEEEIIGRFVKRLEAQKKQNEEFSEIMEVIGNILEGVTDADTANEAMVKLQELHHIGNSKLYASKGLSVKAAEIGLRFDKKDCRYAA